MEQEIELVKGWACHHGEGGKQDMADLRSRVCAALECESDNLVHSVCYALLQLQDGETEVGITGIVCDVWAGVYASTENVDPRVKFWIQCDRIEDGFAMLYEKAIERFPMPTPPQTPD